jgi:hypothetical protein
MFEYEESSTNDRQLHERGMNAAAGHYFSFVMFIARVGIFFLHQALVRTRTSSILGKLAPGNKLGFKTEGRCKTVEFVSTGGWKPTMMHGDGYIIPVSLRYFVSSSHQAKPEGTLKIFSHEQ